MRILKSSLIAIGLLGSLVLFQNCAPGKANDSSSSSGAGSSTRPEILNDPCYNRFCVTYYDEMDHSGASIDVYEAYPINHEWNGDSPDPSMDGDTFSAFYRGIFEFQGGNVQFLANSDDGIQVLVDGQTIIEEYSDHAPAAVDYSAIVPLTAGVHVIEIYYYENGGGASLKLNWQ